jgi:uncharacterized membrane protein YphA (DoxX/SURF4 family)
LILRPLHGGDGDIGDIGDVGDIEVETIGPPLSLLALAGFSIALSCALLLVTGLVTHVVGYVLASVVAIALVGIFHRTDLQRRHSPLYVPRRAFSRYAGALLAIGLLVSAAHTWSIATVLAK